MPNTLLSRKDKLALFVSPTSQHVYALSPGPLPSLSLLSAYSLSTVSHTSAADKWQPAPANGYGSIVHNAGAQRSLTGAKNKGKGKKIIVPTKAALKEKEPEKPTAGKKVVAKPKEKPKAPPPRPMGQLRGLFAPKPEDAVVSAKRKAEPVATKKKTISATATASTSTTTKKAAPVVAKSNGIFANEELDSDEEINEEELAAMMEMEQELERDSKAKAKASTSKKNDKMEVDPPG